MVSEVCEKIGVDKVWASAVKWGFGAIALSLISYGLWNANEKQNEFIREQLLASQKDQTDIIAQNNQVISQNTAAMRDVTNLMERVLRRLED